MKDQEMFIIGPEDGSLVANAKSRKAKTTITIRDVAEESGFSATTVSIVLNNAPLARYIPPHTKTRIQKAAKKLGCAICHHPSYTTPPEGTEIQTLHKKAGSDMAKVPSARTNEMHQGQRTFSFQEKTAAGVAADGALFSGSIMVIGWCLKLSLGKSRAR